MRVINARDSVLTNFEVATLLHAQQRARDEEEKALPLPGARRGETAGSSAWSATQAVAVLSEQVITYLERDGSASQAHEDISNFIAAVGPFDLTRMEVLALVNTPPASIVEVHLLVEECEERLSQEKVRELLALCQRTLRVQSVGHGVDEEMAE